MKLDKLVKKYEKKVLAGVAILLSLSMIVSFMPGSVFGWGSEEVKAAGTFLYVPAEGAAPEEVQVSTREYWRAQSKGPYLLRLRTLLLGVPPDGVDEWYCGPISQEFQRMSQDDPLEDEIKRLREKKLLPEEEPIRDRAKDVYDKIAWEHVILTRYARALGAAVTDVQLGEMIQRLYSRWEERVSRKEYTPENYRAWLEKEFGDKVSVPLFEEALRESMMIARYLAILTAPELPSLKEGYRSAVENSDKIRVAYLRLDPRDAQRLKRLRPIQPAQVVRKYREVVDSELTRKETQVVYLGFFYRDVLDKPDDAKAREYYDKHKDMFKEGDRQLSFDEAKERVILKILREQKESDFFKKSWQVRRFLEDGIEQARRRGYAAKNPEMVNEEGELKKEYYEKHRESFKGEGGRQLSFEEAKTKIRGERVRHELEPKDVILVTDQAKQKFGGGDISLRYGTTPKVWPSMAWLEQVAKMEKLGDWLPLARFVYAEENFRPGKISEVPAKTEEGVVLFVAYSGLKEVKIPPSRGVELFLRSKIEKDAREKLAQGDAWAIVRGIQATGARPAAVVGRHTWLFTDYFSPPSSGKNRSQAIEDMKLSDEQLANEILRALDISDGEGEEGKAKRKPGYATVVSYPKEKEKMFAVMMVDDQFAEPPSPRGLNALLRRDDQRRDLWLKRKEEQRRAILDRSGIGMLLKASPPNK